MEILLNDTVDPNDLIKFRKMYEEQSSRGVPSEKAQFEYAICLVRSKTKGDLDVKHGIALLEDLFKRTHDSATRRDCLFYLAFAYTRLKEYQEALKYTETFLKIEPLNHQVQELQKHIKNKMKKEGLVGMAIVGGAALAVGSLIGFGVAMAKK